MKKKNKTGGFYWERELYQSNAFLSLNKNAIKILIALLDARKAVLNNSGKAGKRNKYVFTNINDLKMPYGLLEKVYKVGRSRIPKAIDMLLSRGFLKITYHGGATKHDLSKYGLSDNFLLWRPGAMPFEVRPKRERHGYQGRSLKKKQKPVLRLRKNRKRLNHEKKS